MINPTQLVIKNIGKIADMTIPINKPLILFYGEIQQGKSTILNAVRWVFGGEFPSDIIQHGKKEGSIELQFDGGIVSRSFYVSKDGDTKARPVEFVRGGKPVKQPATEIKRLLNPFLLDQDFLRNKTELERKQYFAELFALDTTELDTELFNSQREAQQLRSKISGYGDIDLTPAEVVDVAKHKAALQEIRTAHQKKCAEVTESNAAATQRNEAVRSATQTRAEIQTTVENLEAQLVGLKARLVKADKWLKDNPTMAVASMPAQPDTEKLESLIQNGAAQNVRAEQYAANKRRDDERTADQKRLSEMEKRQREIKAKKQAKLKSISDSCGVAGLSFDDDGNFIYQGTTAGMISDSQIMRLSSELSSLYPEGFGLDLIDRAESLGKSIFDFVDRAKAENKTILATIVGERPAKIAPEIGVFVVENGGLAEGPQ